jgi:uncharacterized RDD family membrane protein YckC
MNTDLLFQPEIISAKLWQRIAARFCDNLLLSPIQYLVFLNIIQIQSLTLSAIFCIIPLWYKIFCETIFGKTLGKHILKIKIVKTDGENANLFVILQRNIFFIITSILLIRTQHLLLQEIDILEVDSFAKWTNFKIKHESIANINNNFAFIFALTDIIFLLFSNLNQTFQDQIAKVRVVES